MAAEVLQWVVGSLPERCQGSGTTAIADGPPAFIGLSLLDSRPRRRSAAPPGVQVIRGGGEFMGVGQSGQGLIEL